MCMQRPLHVHAKYFALQQYKTKKRRAERMLRTALYVFLYYLIIFFRRNFVRHRNEPENIYQGL